jgi:quercetin dioxygenase-like cupin family protein
VHVTEGVLRFDVGDEAYRLGKGDSLHFGGQVPHHWENDTKRPAKAVWVALRAG